MTTVCTGSYASEFRLSGKFSRQLKKYLTSQSQKHRDALRPVIQRVRLNVNSSSANLPIVESFEELMQYMVPIGGGLWSASVMIGIGLARELRTMNWKNRKFKKRLHRVIAEAIARGEFRLNGEPILVDQEDHMRNGQHTIEAVLTTGVPVPKVITLGMHPDAYHTMDRRGNRNIAEDMEAKGEKDCNVKASMCNWLYRLVHGGLYAKGYITLSTPQVDAMHDRHPGLWEMHGTYTKGMKSQVTAAMGIALKYWFSTIDPVASSKFFNSLASGANLSETSPIFTLRRRLSNKKTKPTDMDLAAIVIKAFVAYRTGKPMMSLAWREDEEFPSPYLDGETRMTVKDLLM